MKILRYPPYLLLFIIVGLFQISCNSKDVESVMDENWFSNISFQNTSSTNSLLQTDSLKKDSIHITEKPIIDTTKQYIYLTFDDGPYKGSEKINRIIKEEQVKATVFIVGLNSYTATLQQFIDDYKTNNLIEIANHTYSHANRNKFVGYYKQPQVVLEDVIRNDSMFSLTNRIVRLPGRNVWHLGNQKKYDYDNGSKKSANFLAENQYYILGWDYEWKKLKKKKPLEQPSKIYDEIVRRLNNNETLNKNHLVLLMHDDMFNNDVEAEKLRELIQLLKGNKDFILEFASNYPIEIN